MEQALSDKEQVVDVVWGKVQGVAEWVVRFQLDQEEVASARNAVQQPRMPGESLVVR